MKIEDIKIFSKPFYNFKDIMHGLKHIERIHKKALSISENYIDKIDMNVINCASYFHGFIYSDEKKITDFLNSMGVSSIAIAKILQAAKESQVSAMPESLEGKIVHDAHLLEGGNNFIIVKCLVTGTARGQTLEQTIEFIEKNVLGKGKCALQENKQEYAKRQQYTRDFLDELKSEL